VTRPIAFPLSAGTSPAVRVIGSSGQLLRYVLSWTGIADVTGYVVHDANHNSVGSTGPFVTTYTRVGLSENTAYPLHVHAQGAAGTGPASNSVSLYTGVHAPASYEFSTALSFGSQSTVTVTPPPNPTSGLTGCEIQRLIYPSGWIVVKPFSQVYGFTDSGLPASASVLYRIRYQNGDGVATDFSPWQTLSTPSGGPPAPTNFAGTVQSTSSILWAWNDVAGETGFLLRNDVGIVTTLGPGVLSYLETGLAENAQYARYVIAQGTGGTLGSASGRDTKYTFVHDALAGDYSVASSSMSSVNLTFVAPPNGTAGATAVRVERSTDGATWTMVPTLPGVYLVSDTGLLGSTTYQYRFRYLNGDGVWGAASTVKSATTPQATVGPVAGLSVAASLAGIQLSWTANSENVLAGYNVYRSTQSGGPYTKLNAALVATTSYLDGEVSPNTAYFYVVRAQDTAGREGANSNEVSTFAAPPPPTPFIAGIGSQSADSIYVIINAPFFGLYSFEVHDDAHNVTGTFGPVFTDPESGYLVTQTGLQENTQYSRHVHTVKDGHLSAPSETRQGYSLVHDAQNSDFTLSWVPSSSSVSITVVPPPNPTVGNSGVMIFRYNGTFFQFLVTLTGTYSYTDPGLTPGTTYQYKIRYLNGDGVPSALSNSKSIVSPLGEIGSFSGVAQNPGSIRWSWSSAVGATQYLLLDDVQTLIATIDASTLSYQETGLQENTRYSRYVRAVTSQGNGNPSPTATVYTLVRDPQDADWSVVVRPNSDVAITVTPPPGSAAGQTAGEIQRLVGTGWIVVQSFSSAYAFVDTGLTPSITYSYRIRFRNGDGVATAASPQKDVMTGPPPTPAPTGFAGTALTPFSIQWSWDNLAGAGGFEIHDAAQAVKGSVGAGVLSFIETGFAENSPVVRRVYALVDGWLTNGSTPGTRYTLVHDALSSDLAATPISTDLIDLVVTPPPQGTAGLTGCQLERSGNNATWTIVKPFSNVYSFRDTGLLLGTQYYYRVRFRNGDGIEGLPSPSQAVSSLSIGRPVITTGDKKTRNQNTSVRGTADPGVTVTVFFNGAPDGSRLADAGGVWSYFAATKNEGLYTVTARASAGGQTTGDSASIQIQIDLTPPPAPSRVRLTGYHNVIDVEWDPSSAPDLAGYQIFRKFAGTSSWGSPLNATKLVVGTKYRDSTAVTGTRYTYKVVALDDSTYD
jgi:hypothetical protein